MQSLHTLPLKVRVKLCCILQASTIYCLTLAAILIAVSFPHHCHMSGWLSGKSSILKKKNKILLWAILTYLTPKGACKAVLHSASFCNILLNFRSHHDGCKLPSSLPHEWLAEWNEQYSIDTHRKIYWRNSYIPCS